MAEEKANWDYKSDKPKATAKNNSSRIVSWTASEYIDHERNPSWYVVLLISTLIVAGLIYVLTKDYFATGTVLIVGAIVGSVAHWKPQQVEYQLSPEGLRVGDKFYSYSQFKTFSIIHEDQLSSLVFHPLKKLLPPISIFFDGDDEDKITDVVGEHLPLEERAPDRIDRLSRRLRF